MTRARDRTALLAREAPSRLAWIAPLAEVICALIVERRFDRDQADSIIERLADRSGIDAGSVRVLLGTVVVRNPHFLGLPTALAIEAELDALASVARLDGVSFWTKSEGRVACRLHVGPRPSRRARLVAEQALGSGGPNGTALIRGIIIRCWQQPKGAIVFRTRSDVSAVLADEAAGVIGRILEREELLARGIEREELLTAAAERHLTRLGFDIHDGPIQSVVALAGDVDRFRTNVARLGLDDERETRIAGWIADIESRLAAVDDEMRALANSLAHAGQTELPFERAVAAEVDAFRQRSGLKIALDLSGEFDALSRSQRIALLRILQEGLANVREHSGAKSVVISVRAEPSFFRAELEDDGRGFDVRREVVRAAEKGRLGLVGMNERVRLLGGTFDVQSRPGGPTCVSVTLPEWRPVSETSEPATRRA